MNEQPDEVVFARGAEVLAARTLALTLFFDTVSVQRVALAAMVAEAVMLVAPQAHWARFGTMTRNEAIDASIASGAIAYVRQMLAERKDAELAIDAGPTLDGVGSWAVRYGDSPSYEGDLLGYVQLSLPLEQTDALLRLALRWFGEVNFVHGRGGLHVNYDHGDIDVQRNMAMRGHCERYRGVDLDDLVTERRALHELIKNAQWLILIGNGMLARDEAQANVLRALPETLTTPHGLVLRVCERPVPGDAHRCEDMTAMREMNAMLAPWLVDNLFPLPGFPDEEATRTWLHALRPER
jgi:hypothetical protein